MRREKSLRRRLLGLKKSEAGNIAIVSALTMPLVVGFCGLGIETAYWFYKQRVLQGSADVTAYNGAVALRNAETIASIKSQAPTDAGANGWIAPNGTITVNTPPTSGNNQNANSVEVILTENETRLFSKMFVSTPVKIQVRSVATYASSGQACLLALNKTAQNAVKVWGNNTTTLNGCNIMSNSFAPNAVGFGGSSVTTVPCVLAVGGVSVASTLNLTKCSTPTTNAAPAKDPYANVPAPAVTGPCKTVPPGAAPIQPGRYCGGLSVNGTKTFTSGGVYVIDGGTFQLNGNAVVQGSGVTFYLTNGATVAFNGNAHLDFSAPTSGTYSGILFFGDRNQANALQKFNGDATSSMTGAIYMPSQAVQQNGNFSGANGCMQVIADTIDYSGSATFSSNCPNSGMSNVAVPGAVSLVE
jgi:hypothetical protein